MMILVLEGSINNIKNVDKYEEAYEKEDEDEDSDINMYTSDNIE
jgi:hypothetical protein